MLNIGTKAPDFTLKEADGTDVSLKDFRGRTVVLYFYSRDNTAGCTRQALNYKELFKDFSSRNIVVIGISKDTPASHRKFKEKYDLPFRLLSDPELEVIKAYDVWGQKKLYGQTSYGVIRSSYVIDGDGKIIRAETKVNPQTDAEAVLSYIR